MNFFEAQDRSRRTSRWLVVLFLLATLAIIAAVTLVVAATLSLTQPGAGIVTGGTGWLTASSGLLVAVALATAALIGLASLYRTARLSSGGGRVARELGGTLVPSDVQDPLRLRLRNVVEEMAIASGVPVPEIYVLEEEPGINAFAAGFNPGDAAVAVTRGTLELLDRDELQGVIGHEFSHILNGDMRLNIRLMGLLFGILAIGLAGRMILRGTRHVRFTSSRSGRGGGAPVVLVLGVGLFLIGSIGLFFARLIKAGVSRQREYLADASAVQFTRQSRGIAGALKKIGAAASPGSRIRETDPEEVSHMLFALGARHSLTRLMATHPPLEDRIRALDPSFDPAELAAVAITGESGAGESDAAVSRLAAGGVTALEAERITSTIGNPGQQHVAFAGRLRRSLPEGVYHAAHSRHQVTQLVLALVLAGETSHRNRQLRLLSQRIGELRAGQVQRLYQDITALGPLYRLPLLEVSFPALKDRPAGQLSFLVDLVNELAETDGHVDFFEYCFTRTLFGHLAEAVAPSQEARHRGSDLDGRRVRESVSVLLSVLATEGTADEKARRGAYSAGVATLDGDWPEFRPAEDWITALDEALETLRHLSGRARRRLVIALVATIRHDRRTTLAEAELLRAMCAMLDCPLPPLAAEEVPAA